MTLLFVSKQFLILKIILLLSVKTHIVLKLFKAIYRIEFQIWKLSSFVPHLNWILVYLCLAPSLATYDHILAAFYKSGNILKRRSPTPPPGGGPVRLCGLLGAALLTKI